MRQLLERQGRPAPAFVMDPEVTDFYRFTRDSFRLEGYDPLPFDEKDPRGHLIFPAPQAFS